MEINQLVKVSGQISTIVELSPGDVYKRLITSDYRPDKIVLGVVTDVFANGETAAISTIEYSEGYPSVEVKTQVFAGNKEVQIFPVTVDELKSRIGDLIATARQGEKKANDELIRAKNILEQLETIRDSDIQEAKTTVSAE